ncbi:ABC transporter ATP-binding protein [Polymorphum gilvum]|uniref:ABC transporter, nucleotide binding/ATPase protein n=1 Tax=Polymorphum gilvum (strain LMG 25793 / CGMCC 1.9160 / SL003B-26A1) TaxID=991905 RepID=F2J1J9_POLGS|nr:ABC transporter ATP-binding protein [Polymorphum gilvum]ADZ70800.1 ABC transporter, nucleotide binding/ATPase protein [Polymorphum gilvum SL003B-26A1]
MAVIKAIAGRLFQDPDGTLSLLRRLVSENARAHLPRYAIAFVFMALVAASTAASAWIMRDVINEVFINRDPTMIVAIALAVMAIFTVKGAATYGQIVVLSRIGNAIVADCQRRLFDTVTRQDLAFFDRTALGDLATRLSHNTQAARAVLDMVVTSIGRDLLTIVGLVTVMVVQDPGLSIIALLIMPPAVIGVSMLVRRVRKHARSQFVSMTRIVSAVQETAIGIRVVKAFGVEARMRREMNRAVEDVEHRANRIASLSARTSPLMETLGGFAVALVILYGGYSVVELDQDPGGFFAFITALLLAYDPAKRLARLHVNLSSGLVGVRLMYELLDQPPSFVDRDGTGTLAVGTGEIRFKDVTFGYGEAQALRGLTMVAEAGKVTALVGASGAGKSTTFSLIERFYDVTGGRILIDGQDIRTVSVASLRGQIALVTQDTFLFDLSIRDNIALGRPGAGDAEIIRAAMDANAHEFILELDQGYDTPAGEGGTRLSGGQRQRVAIARAMLRNAPILLLDEATSALDAESEAKVQGALKRLMKGRTTLVIAHRLATVRDADMIHVLDRGQVAESGSHADLFARDGLYRRLYDLQFRPADRSAAE